VRVTALSGIYYSGPSSTLQVTVNSYNVTYTILRSSVLETVLIWGINLRNVAKARARTHNL